MILGDFNHIDSLSTFSPAVSDALRWASEHRNAIFKTGRIELPGGKTYVNAEEVELADAESRLLEAHRKYIDIHVPVDSNEIIGWSVTDSLRHVDMPYDGDRDVAFFSDRPQATFSVAPGQFVIFFPEDAHAPNIGQGVHRKLCVKIPLESL